MKTRMLAVALLGASLLSLTGCGHKNATIIDPFAHDVNWQWDGWGLRKLSPDQYPDMRLAFQDREGLERAIQKSLQFLSAPSTVRLYPSGLQNPDGLTDTITHGQIKATLEDMLRMLRDPSMTPDQFQAQLLARYDVYESIGFDNQGSVWFTGYFTPIYQGSRTPTAEFRYPVYRRPSDLVSDPISGEVKGQQMPDGSFRPYPTRSELLASGKLRGLELMYFRDPMEAYIIQVQGSAQVITPDGQRVYLGYAGKNGREYKGLGSQLLAEGVLKPEELSLPAVLDYFKQHPEKRDEYIMRSDSFVFMKEYDPKEWPSGSLGVQVTPHRSLATDKRIFPRASLTFIAVDKATPDGMSKQPYRGFLLDQDTGGAIKAPGRADIYMGIGDDAGRQAGRQFAQGHLYYLFLKPGQYAETVPPVRHPAMKPGTVPGKMTPSDPVRRPMGAPVAPGGSDSEIFPGAAKR